MPIAANRARLADAQIAAIGYLALHYSLDPERSTDPGRYIKQPLLGYLSEYTYWHPLSRFLHTGLNMSTLEWALKDVPLGKPLPGFPAPPEPDWLPPSLIVGKATMLSVQANKLFFVFFTAAASCPFEETTIRTREFVDYAKNNLIPIKVILTSQQTEYYDERMAQKKYGVSKLPALIVLSFNGTELGRPATSEAGPGPLIAALEAFKKNNAALQAAQPQPKQPSNRRPPRRTGVPFQ